MRGMASNCDPARFVGMLVLPRTPFHGDQVPTLFFN